MSDARYQVLGVRFPVSRPNRSALFPTPDTSSPPDTFPPQFVSFSTRFNSASANSGPRVLFPANSNDYA